MNVSKLKSRVATLVKFTEEDFAMFTSHLKTVSLKRNEIWEHAGVVSKNMGFVNSGILRQYYIKNGNEYTDNFFVENDFTGNYISHLSLEPSKTYTIAVESCEILVVPFLQLENLFTVLPVVKKFSEMIGEQKLFELSRRNSSFLMDNPEERYYHLMKEKPSLINRVPQYLIAQYLGIKPESLSRIKKRHIS